MIETTTLNKIIKQAESHEKKAAELKEEAKFHIGEALKLRTAIKILSGETKKIVRPKSQFYRGTLPSQIFSILDQYPNSRSSTIIHLLIKEKKIPKGETKSFTASVYRALSRLVSDKKIKRSDGLFSIAGKIEKGF